MEYTSMMAEGPENLPSQYIGVPMEDSAPPKYSGALSTSTSFSFQDAAPAGIAGKHRVYVEVCRVEGPVSDGEIAKATARVLRKGFRAPVKGSIAIVLDEEPLLKFVRSITLDCSDETATAEMLLFWQIDYEISVYQVHPCKQVVEDVDGEDEEVASFNAWPLPSVEFEGLWDSLHYDDGIKQRLLRYASSALFFSEMGVNSHLVNWNRVVLLFGPPGTGKTSLCKGVAQKLAIRYANQYPEVQLVEINAHSLFSKWFSESAKLVTKLFDRIRSLVANNDCLLFVLIDEVESLSAARQAALAGSDPSDSIRVVNALLTQLDALQNFPNVMILATSNITKAIDIAFIDRADIKAYIGPPSTQSIYEILGASVVELLQAGILTAEPQVSSVVPLPFSQAKMANGPTPDAAARLSQCLLDISRSCEGFSGRTLRKLPFLAHANYVAGKEVPLDEFLNCLAKTVQNERDDRANMSSHENPQK